MMIARRDLFKALIDGRLDDLAEILHTGADVDVVADFNTSLLDESNISEGDTLVHVAIHKRNHDALDLLLRFNANLNVAAKDGVTPLQIAVNSEQDNLALWLLDNGANFNTMDKFGLTPLHYTINLEILERILAKGVSVDLKAHSTGYTPLHYAAYHNCASKARFLLSHNADPRECGNCGETALHLLMALKYQDIVACGNMLLSAGADVNAQDKEGNTPLHWAIGAHASANWQDRGNTEAVRFLLNHKANVRLKNRRGLTPIALAWRWSTDREYRKPFQELAIKPKLGEHIRAFF